MLQIHAAIIIDVTDLTDGNNMGSHTSYRATMKLPAVVNSPLCSNEFGASSDSGITTV